MATRTSLYCHILPLFIMFVSLPLQLRGHPHILKLVSTAFAGPEGAETDGERGEMRNRVCVCGGGGSTN